MGAVGTLAGGLQSGPPVLLPGMILRDCPWWWDGGVLCYGRAAKVAVRQVTPWDFRPPRILGGLLSSHPSCVLTPLGCTMLFVGPWIFQKGEGHGYHHFQQDDRRTET